MFKLILFPFYLMIWICVLPIKAMMWMLKTSLKFAFYAAIGVFLLLLLLF